MYTLSRAPARGAQAQFVCASCRQQIRRLWQHPTGKDQRSKYAAKVRGAEAEWAAKADKIRGGAKESMLSILEKRGFVHAVAGDRNELDKLMTDTRIGAYVGVDPTAPSLHLGNLLPLMSLLWMYLEGFQAITVLGGATVKVGDPAGRMTSRDMPESAIRKANMASMHLQIKKIWANMEAYAEQRWQWQRGWAHKRGMVNNSDWMNKTSIIEFLRTAGAAARVGPLLGRDTARAKMEKGDGLSFAELSYPLLQGWDWWQLLQSRGVQLQIGGSDQFGNIISGMDVVSNMQKNHLGSLPEVLADMKPYGFTVPLLTTSKGEKFGKSAGNAIWLDKDMTTSFALYQFLLRSADADVERYLKLFTLFPLPEIETLVAEHQKDPGQRVAQRALAKEVVSMLHGIKAAQQVEYETGVLLTAPKEPRTPDVKTKHPGAINSLLNPQAPQFNAHNTPTPNVVLPESLVRDQPFARVLFHAGLVNSRKEGNRLIQLGGAHIGSKPAHRGNMPDSLKYTKVKPLEAKDTWEYVLEDSLMILRAGKWNVKIVKIIPDSEFDAQGLDAPGWKEFKEKAVVVSEELVKSES